ncbi:MAG: PIN domain-containing protein [Opitutales bacterium]|nr:PIN domain-containing protein [Opitutales bacterium]MCH8541147.1 PIN domain-containing protein [Opitutales bacterium]
MIYLLDTHALWHHASDGDELSSEAAAQLDAAKLEDICVLDVSLYELARHMAVGRIEVEDPLSTLVTIEKNYPIIQSNAAIAWKSASLDWPKRKGKGQHLDPADRAIFAAAILHNLTVVTADKEMHAHGPVAGVSLLW